MSEMTDARFMTAVEKRQVLKHWEAFLKGGMSRDHFTSALYEHLIQHCSFIAHYDRQGFYDYCFRSGDMKKRFLSQFDPSGDCRSVEIGMTYWLDGEYSDVNRAMVEIAGRCMPALIQDTETSQRDADIAEAKRLLARHGLELEDID